MKKKKSSLPLYMKNKKTNTVYSYEYLKTAVSSKIYQTDKMLTTGFYKSISNFEEDEK